VSADFPQPDSTSTLSIIDKLMTSSHIDIFDWYSPRSATEFIDML